MAGKLALVFLVAFVAVQCATALPRERRDAAEATTPDTLTNIQNFFKDNFQVDKVIDNLKEFGEKVSSGTKEFAETVQKKASEIFNSDNKAETKTK